MQKIKHLWQLFIAKVPAELKALQRFLLWVGTIITAVLGWLMAYGVMNKDFIWLVYIGGGIVAINTGIQFATSPTAVQVERNDEVVLKIPPTPPPDVSVYSSSTNSTQNSNT